ncbi:hypothetical protein [Actinoplanes italicus]|nr:hypothetical protein [Actinoplanes italicus]
MILDRLLTDGSSVLAAIFVAACAERAINIASWAAALDSRPGDAAIYVETLEFLWRPGAVDPQDVRVRMARLEEAHEMTMADELSGLPLYGLGSVLVLHSGLGVLAEPTPANLEDCSMAARNAAFHLEGLVPAQRFLSGEKRSQDEDIKALAEGVSADELRNRARAAGRDRLNLIRSRA